MKSCPGRCLGREQSAHRITICKIYEVEKPGQIGGTDWGPCGLSAVGEMESEVKDAETGRVEGGVSRAQSLPKDFGFFPKYIK